MLCLYDEDIWDIDRDHMLNDCRTPPPPQKPLQPSVGTRDRLKAHPLLRTISLDDDFVVAYVPSHSRVAVLDKEAFVLLQQMPVVSPSNIATLEMVETLSTLGLATADDGRLPTPPAPDTLVAWMHMTNNCNLRCTYCYLAKTRETMSPAIAQAGIDAVFRSAIANGYRNVALKYAGGEATLAMSEIERTHAYACEQAFRHGMHLTASLLSNGTALSAQRLHRISELGLHLVISLDGMDSTHDVQRPTIGGRGSAHAVLDGIMLALEHDVIPTIAITVTGQSIAGLPDLVTWLLRHELPFTLSFYRENDSSTSPETLRLNEQKIIAGMRAAYAVVAAHPPRWSVLGALLDRADLGGSHSRACATGHNYLVIDHHGKIAKCQMEMRRAITTVAADDPLRLLRTDVHGIQNLPVDEKEGCRTCDWRYWCAGGCPIATFRATGRFDIRSPNCMIYQALYPDLLHLEGLRLLHLYRMRSLLPTHQAVSSY